MGTRGRIGFKVRGQLYLGWLPCDTYPLGLGLKLVNEIKAAIAQHRFHEWTYLARVLEIIDDEDTSYRHESFEEIFTSGTFLLDEVSEFEYSYILDLDKYRFIFFDSHTTIRYSIFKLPNFFEYEEQKDSYEDEQFF